MGEPMAVESQAQVNPVIVEAFDSLRTSMDAQFESVERRMAEGFAAVNGRLDRVESRLNDIDAILKVIFEQIQATSAAIKSNSDAIKSLAERR